uniref:Tubulin--tyrosine ligase-like protein 12 SET-like domain-containing protein n=2 Tax=Acrobeloides nanus TaxID=290746 RepID=A0A914CXW8_9BILA
MAENGDQFSFEEFVAIHESQLVASGVPQHFWNHLYSKLMNEVFDAGDSMMMVVDSETCNWSVFATKDILFNDSNNIFLIDHAWTFRPNNARRALQEVPGLKERLIEAFNIKGALDELVSCSEYVGSESGDTKIEGSSKSNDADDSSASDDEESFKSDKIIEAILDKIWNYAQTYTVKIRKATVDDNDLPVWYIPDEFGLRIGHSKDPNFKVVPFFYVFQNIAYSLLFPLRNVADEEEVTRNYVDTKILLEHPEWYDILMIPWEPIDLSGNDVLHKPKSNSYYLGGREPDELPDEPQNAALIGSKPKNSVHKVYVTNRQLVDNLRQIKVELVDDPYEADIIWMNEHFHNFK